MIHRVYEKSGQNKEEGDKNQSGSPWIDGRVKQAGRRGWEDRHFESRPPGCQPTSRSLVAVPVTRSFTNGGDEEKYDDDDDDDDDEDEEDVGVRDDTHRKTRISGVDA
ncbi:hypothetical protein ALC62_11245 [Cyphomyrmex costatus]|uniref:Uncharacterized protein n=1 Tax=Cyphomyrmex costatus TaxID=456900 RepID=A0A195CAK2_9HYME|nr:hypothetical protein ALC62_11245 [Cyphomyrmex costatus]